ncbi:MAG: hypothetical protein ACXWJJ_01915 [Ramlibacter sp.]
METNVTPGSGAATEATAHPQQGAHPADPSVRKTRSRLAACAIAVVVAIFLWAGWPGGASGGMTAEDFRQMYEGCSSEKPACPPPVFP